MHGHRVRRSTRTLPCYGGTDAADAFRRDCGNAYSQAATLLAAATGWWRHHYHTVVDSATVARHPCKTMGGWRTDVVTLHSYTLPPCLHPPNKTACMLHCATNQVVRGAHSHWHRCYCTTTDPILPPFIHTPMYAVASQPSCKMDTQGMGLQNNSQWHRCLCPTL